MFTKPSVYLGGKGFNRLGGGRYGEKDRDREKDKYIDRWMDRTKD